MNPFDPQQVYLRGPLQKGASTGLFAIAPLSDPNVALTGFGTFMSDEVIRPSDGSLLFTDPKGFYVFTPDECVTEPPTTYAKDPLNNDAKLTGPAGCDVAGFRLAPNGAFLYRCHDNWMTDSGQTVATSNGPFLSFDGERILTGQGVFNVAEQAVHAFVGLPTGVQIVGQRVQADGFWMVTSADDGTQSKLWLVDAAGNLELQGDYPDPPTDPQYGPLWTSVAGDGALIQIGSRTQGSTRTNVIIRRTTQGEFAVVYDESTNPLVWVSYPQLVTGP